MNYFEEAVRLLEKLISIPSFSDQEDDVAAVWEDWLRKHGAENVARFHNNVYALSSGFDPSKPILMLNSHMDTVLPSQSYTRDPFSPTIEEGKLFGLGSNDAGGCGVCLASTFLQFKDDNELPFNLLFAITASEEKMGEKGMRAFLPYLREEGLYPQMAIVGEPTGCQAAIAERGLVVCDALVEGKSGHAARNEGINAIYRAIEDIEIIRNFKWPESEILGPVKSTVTMIEAGTQHNVVPDKCKYVVDIRTIEVLSNEETVAKLQQELKWSKLTPRSLRLQASALKKNHPLILAAVKTGMELYTSPTSSDMMNMRDISSIKIGPGESARSHSADEFIYLEEIRKGIDTYHEYLLNLARTLEIR